MSKKSSKAVEDNPDLMLDVKTMDALTRKMMETIMPNFEQMLKSAVDMMRNEPVEQYLHLNQSGVECRKDLILGRCCS